MTAPTPVVHDTMLPVRFEPPLRNPAPAGLFAAVQWTAVGPDEPSRHLSGVEVREVGNYPGLQVGVWERAWCRPPAPTGSDRKSGTRGDVLDAFEPVVVWAFDSCDLTEPSRREVEARAAQALRVRESVVVGRDFADRLLADAGTPTSAEDAVAALGHLEGVLAEANTIALVHASPVLLPVLVSAHLVTRSGAGWVTPAGHSLVIGGGYLTGLGATLVATSAPLFGWRDNPQVRTAIDEKANTFIAVAERTVVIGYEAALAAVTVTP